MKGMKMGAKKGAVKKMANGGMAMPTTGRPTAMPANSNKGGAMRGLARAAAMSGRTFANGGAVKGKPFVKGMAKGKKGC